MSRKGKSRKGPKVTKGEMRKKRHERERERVHVVQEESNKSKRAERGEMADCPGEP